MACLNKFVPLGQLGEVVSGSTPDTTRADFWNGDIPWITPSDLTDHQGVFFTGNLRKITPLGYKNCSTRLLPKGSILFSSRAPIGHCAVTAFELCTNQGFKSLIPNDKLDAVYGFFALTAYKQQLVNLGRGATFAELSKELFESFEIPIPSTFAEQKRIAAQLAKADRIRRLRRAALNQSESFLQSVFLEMFGDPVANTKQWEIRTIAELGHVQTGNTPSRNNISYFGSFIEWIKSDNISDDEMFVSQSREMLSAEGMAEGRCVEPMSIMMTCIAGSLNSIGSVAITDRRVAFNQQINAITPFHDVDSLFLHSMFKMAKRYIQSSASDGMKHLLTKSKLEEITLICPPFSFQQRFAAVARGHERLRAQQREGLRQAEHLFQSLLHEAFGQERN
jgi:type I restriction enzyme S subunit